MTDRTDNFNRANVATSLGTPSDGGTDWACNFTDWGISSNQAHNTEAGVDWHPAILESSVSAVEVQATLTALADGLNAAMCGRYADDNNYIRLQLVAGASGTIKLTKRVAGTETQLGSTYTGAVAVNDVFKLRMDSANLLTAYQNGVSRVSATDAAGAANTRHGLIAFDPESWDDFSITEIVAGGGGIPSRARTIFVMP